MQTQTVNMLRNVNNAQDIISAKSEELKDIFSGGKKKKIVKKPVKKIQNSKSFRSKKPKTIYFDNNGTTLICSQASKKVIEWQKCYNPSSDGKEATSARRLLKTSKNYIHKHCETGGDDKYTILFTSGATESNCTIIRMIVDAYHRNMFEVPHIITSEIEHHSTLACLNDLENNKRATVTYIKPNIYGTISPKEVKKAINEKTCLVTIMWANNEIGCCNNVRELAKVTHENSTSKFRIPFHTDAVQIFGKHKFPLHEENKNGMEDIDALSMSFHKLYGPKHVGLLIIKKDIVDGFDLKAIINGSQQDGLRGGTEDLPGIAGSIEALKHTFQNRTKKNKYLMNLKILMLELLSKQFKFIDYKDYLLSVDNENKKIDETKRENIELILLGHPNHKRKILPNTILLSIIKHKGSPFCNIKFKKKLNKENIIVSISSTCLTSQKSSSHVLDAIRAPEKVRNGVIRISFSDNNTESEVRKFVTVFTKLLKG